MNLLVGNVKCLENLINFNFMIIAKLHRSVRIILVCCCKHRKRNENEGKNVIDSLSVGT